MMVQLLWLLPMLSKIGQILWRYLILKGTSKRISWIPNTLLQIKLLWAQKWRTITAGITFGLSLLDQVLHGQTELKQASTCLRNRSHWCLFPWRMIHCLPISPTNSCWDKHVSQGIPWSHTGDWISIWKETCRSYGDWTHESCAAHYWGPCSLETDWSAKVTGDAKVSWGKTIWWPSKRHCK